MEIRDHQDIVSPAWMGIRASGISLAYMEGDQGIIGTSLTCMEGDQLSPSPLGYAPVFSNFTPQESPPLLPELRN
jgi:hypothetical protein